MSKIRVHELAKELGKQNKDILNFLAEKGIEVKRYLSQIMLLLLLLCLMKI